MPKDDKNYIIYVHGFLGSEDNFTEIADFNSKLGYHTVLKEFSTFDGGVEKLANEFIPSCLEEAKDAKTIHFITHSMGALILRSYLAKHKIDRLGRVVMIAPPNHGSEVADRMSKYDWWVSMFGDAGLDLRTSAEIPNMPKDIEFGVVAGTASWNYISKDWIPGEDDGWVGLESTKLEGMSDFVTVNSSHGLITANETVIAQALYFLNAGHFASNIEMRGSKIDVDDLTDMDEISAKTTKKVLAWYDKFFGDEDEETVTASRKTLDKQVKDYNKWFEHWRERYSKTEKA